MSQADSPAELETAVAPTRAGSSEDLRFAKLEGRVHALEAQTVQLMAIERGRKQRALLYRLALLALMLVGFFVLRLRQAGSP